VDEAYFTTEDGTWFTPSDLARGPWDPDSCHGGPPTALVIRALEGLGLEHRLTRLTLSLQRPVPMAGFHVEAAIQHAGRTTATTTASIRDGQGRVRATASALHVVPVHAPTPTAPIDPPDFDESMPGDYPVPSDHMGDLRLFSDSIEVRHDPGNPRRADGSLGALGPTTMWMRSVAIVADEVPTPLQLLGPLADCGNGLSFNVPVEELSCVNPDLTLTLLRPPVGQWFASRAATHTSDDGIGFSDAHLFDVEGLVGRVTQSLVLRPT
jgi:hypothetical protein